MIYTKRYERDMLTSIYAVQNIKQLQNSKILITGASGLICSAVVDMLMTMNDSMDLNISVYAAGRNREKIERRFSHWQNSKMFHYLHYDATEPFSTDVVFDYIIHGAGNANPSLYVQEPVETMLGNFLGMKELLDYSRNNKIRRILYISSSEVYGNNQTARPYREEDYGFVDILDPRSCYPSSKRATETLCAAYCLEYGVDYVIGRPGHIYGPTMTASDCRASSQFPRDVLEGKDIVMKSKGEQMRSYCYVLDCSSALLTILLAGKSGQAYNISNRDSVVSIRELAECIARESGHKVVFEIPSEQEKMGYNKMNTSALNAEKLENLGWNAAFSLVQGVQGTLDAGAEE